MSALPYDPSSAINHPSPEHLERRQVLEGNGVPPSSLGNDLDLYIDKDSSLAYVKVDGAWILISGSSTVSGGGGTVFSLVDPEGVITADPSTICWQHTTQTFWVKDSGTGNTGWVLI